jgi:HK97 family phage major capsid protein
MNNLEKRQERAALVREMVELSQANDAASQSRWRELDAHQESLRVQIEQTERASALSTEMDTVRNAERPNVGTDMGHSTLTASQQARSTASYKKSFEHWLRTGERNAELRALGDAAGAQGATLVPQGFEAELETKMKYWGGVGNICRQLNTSTGNPLPWPTMDDTSNVGEWLAEAAPTTNADPTFSNVVLGANLLSSKQVKVSVALEMDSAFDISGLLSDAFGERLGRAMDTAFWTGDGSTIPVTGLLTALQAAGGRSVLAIGANNNSGNAGDTSLTSIGTDDFSNLIDKLDRAYQKPTNKFVFSQTTKNTLRKLKDKYGRPIWEVSLAQGEPDTIFGYGYQIDNAFANIGAGNISAAFGDFSKYVVRKVQGIALVRFNELYMVNYQRAYQAFIRVDAKLLQSAAFSYLTHPLS